MSGRRRRDGTAEPRKVMISWTPAATRSTGLARSIGAEDLAIAWTRQGGPRSRKLYSWLRSGPRTWRVVRSLPPGSLAVLMTPPVFSPLIAYFARREGVHLAIDMHSSAVDSPLWRWSTPLLRWTLPRLDAVVVTNRGILTGYELRSAQLIEVIDPVLSALSDDEFGAPRERLSPRPLVLFPASGNHDEPLDALATAAEALKDEVRIVATGRLPEHLGRGAMETPGYLSRREYEKLLAEAALVLALTTREHTNQRAACEALAAGAPLVCSATEMLREAYAPAAVFVENDAASITEGIREALRSYNHLASQVPMVRERIRDLSAAGLSRLERFAGPSGFAQP